MYTPYPIFFELPPVRELSPLKRPAVPQLSSSLIFSLAQLRLEHFGLSLLILPRRSGSPRNGPSSLSIRFSPPRPFAVRADADRCHNSSLTFFPRPLLLIVSSLPSTSRLRVVSFPQAPLLLDRILFSSVIRLVSLSVMVVPQRGIPTLSSPIFLFRELPPTLSSPAIGAFFTPVAHEASFWRDLCLG